MEIGPWVWAPTPSGQPGGAEAVPVGRYPKMILVCVSRIPVTITHPQLRSFVLILSASTRGALVSRPQGRIVLPSIVVEIVLGIRVGSHALRRLAPTLPARTAGVGCLIEGH